MSLLRLLFLIIGVTITFSASCLATDFDNTTAASKSQYLAKTKATKDYHVLMLHAVNRERVARGLPKLCLNKKLRHAALEHSRDMAKRRFMSHIGSDGSTLPSRVESAGYNWSHVAENVAAGQKTVAIVMASWMDSKHHRANILSVDARMFECGYAYSSNSKYKHYWTQDFGSSSDERCD